MRNHKPLVLISIALVLVVSLAAPSTSLAQGNGDGDTPGEALGVLENTFKNLGVLAIKFMYTLSFIVVLVGGVKNGFAINVAQQIGVAHPVCAGSREIDIPVTPNLMFTGSCVDFQVTAGIKLEYTFKNCVWFRHIAEGQVIFDTPHIQFARQMRVAHQRF